MKSDILSKTASFQEGLPSPLAELAMMEQLFDHVPEIVFFVKDHNGRYVAVNESLVERCGLREKRQLLGRHVRDIFPKELAERYAKQDQSVLLKGQPIIDRLELHWYIRRRSGWCLTTKLPARDRAGRIVGVVGVSRDLRAPGDRDIIPARLASTLEFLETHYADTTTLGGFCRVMG